MILRTLFITYRVISRFYCSERKTVMKYLCVAEKNDAAKNIAAILSRGHSSRRDGASVYNKIYEFDCVVNGEPSKCVMTSVSGHVLNFAFSGQYKDWRACNPIELFSAPVNKICTEQAKNVMINLEREVRYCQGLIIWTDCDREGENIGFEIISICEKVKKLSVFRAKFSEITATSIWRAINNLGPPDKRQSDAVDVRSEIDLRTGAAFTRLQTLRLQHVFPSILQQKLISYGSCQFPTLGFVVERYKAIENFIPEQFWQINLSHTVKKITTNFTWDRYRLFDKTAVMVLFDFCLQAKLATIKSVESKPKSKWRPVPLDTIEMEKIISRKLRINAKQVMKIAEKLYTSGYISYPRTETNIFPKEMNLGALVQQHTTDPNWGQFATRIIDEGGPTPRQGKKSDQAHPPIHPTKYVGNLSGDEKKVYEYIVRHFLACVYKDAKGHETIVKADCGNEKFTAKGLVILERNYLDVYIYETWNGKEINEYQVGDTFEPTILEMGEGITSPPKLLTEADLIALMEKHGIGTDATHAEHIETIKSREYVSLQQNMYFLPAALGMGLVEGYNNMELQISLAKPNLRSDFENDLKLICDGLKTAGEVLRHQIAIYREVFSIVAQKMDAIDSSLSNRLNSAPQAYAEPTFARNNNKPVRKCPKCSADMILRQRTNGAGWFVGCVNFPKCTYAYWFNGISAVEVVDQSCNECGPNTRLLKVTFVNNPFRHLPNPNILCIGGCDPNNLMVLTNQPMDIINARPTSNTNTNQPQQAQSTTNRDTQSSSFVQSNLGSWMGTSSNNLPLPNLPRNNNPGPKNSKTGTKNARKTVSNTSRVNASNSINQRNSTPAPISEDDKQICHCNLEAVTLTCRNGNNAGREFYKCRNSTMEGGGCNYFLWKTPELTNAQPQPSTSFNSNNDNNQNRSDDEDGGNCNCNLPRVLRTVSKDGVNKGRQFYCCSKPVGQGCKYFEWADDVAPKTDRKTNHKQTKKRKGASKNSPGAKRSRRKCGLCQGEGHTRTTCPNKQDEDF